MPNSKETSSSEEVVKHLRAIMLLQLRETLPDVDVKSEVLLSKAGFTHGEIAELLGKSPAAVAKTIQRARQKEPKEKEAINE